VLESSELEYRKYGSREILQTQNKEVSVNNKSRYEGLSQTNLVIIINRRAQNNVTALARHRELILFARWSLKIFIYLSNNKYAHLMSRSIHQIIILLV